MIRPRWRKVWADLWENRVRTLLVIASIAIGVFAVGMIAGAYVIIPDSMNSSYTGANPANIKLLTYPFEQDLVDRIGQIDGVQEAEGRREVTVRVKTGAGEWTNMKLIARPFAEDGGINKLLHLDGKPTPSDQQAVLIQDALDELNTDPGAELEIELSDGTRRKLPVVGVANELTAGIEGILDKKRGFVTYETLEWLHEPPNYNWLYVAVSDYPDDEAYIQTVADRVSDQLEASSRQVLFSEKARSDEHPAIDIVQAVLGVLGLLGVLIVFLSSSLIANTLTALLNQQTRQIGVMKLVGARRSQIVFMYLTLILVFGLISLVIAIPLGGWGAIGLSHILGDFIKIITPGFSLFPIFPAAVAIQIVIALGVPLMAGSIPVLMGSRTTIAAAFNASSLSSEAGRKGWIDRQLERVRIQSGTLLISLRNTFRRKGRLVLTLITLSLGGAIFISVFNVQVSLNERTEQITRYFTSDVNLEFNRSYRVEELEKVASGIPGVVHVEGWAATTADMVDEQGETLDSLSILAPPAGTELVVPIMLDGRWLLEGDQRAIAVNETFWEKNPELAPGDSLRLKIDREEQDWTVVGIFQYAGLDQLFAYTTYEVLSRELNQPYRAATYRIVTEQHDLAYQEMMRARVDSRFRELGYQVKDVESGGSFIKRITEMLEVLITILVIMALLTAIVGSIGMAGTLSMNILERTREIGVLRAIGAYDQVVIGLVVIEGLLIGLISYIVGALLSFPITSLLSNIINIAIFNSPGESAFTPSGFLIWGIVVLALSGLASILPARNASRMTIREVLAYE